MIHVSGNEIYLYGGVGMETTSGDMFSANDVAKALSKLKGQSVQVYIDSPGGSATMGLAIYEQLKRHRGGVDTFVDGLAASCAAIVFMAGSKRSMARNAKLMIHSSWTGVEGNAKSLTDTADTLKKIDATMVSIFAEASNLSRERIQTMLAAETWFNAEEALQAGLATSIVGKTSQQVAAMLGKRRSAFAARSRMMKLAV